MNRSTAGLLATLVIAGSAVGFAAGAVASVPDANGVIHGCYRKADGRLRVINTDRGQSCIKGERLLDWSKQGPQGVQGLQGEQGIQGPTGTPGVTSPAITEHLTSSFTPATDRSSVVSWTQPPNTVATVYWRVSLIAPGGTCQSEEAAVAGNLQFWLNAADAGTESSMLTVGPGETKTWPVVGSRHFGGLLPGQYELTTDMPNDYPPAPDCTATVIETEVFVETVASGT
jgi:hypothetical protein